MARAKRERPPDPDRLVRRAAGDLHTEDGRFEVSSQGGAGRWYATDTERHDQLGLALVLGPFATLDEVRAAITSQRSAPAGDDGPLPEPPPPTDAPTGRRSHSTSKRAPAAQPEPEPPPPPPPVRIERPRWRTRHDERDAVVEAVRRIDDAWLGGDADAMADDLHGSVVMLVTGSTQRLEGRSAVIEHHRGLAAAGRLVAWSERDLTIDVVGPVAVVRHRFEFEREVDGETLREAGWSLSVLVRERDRWLLAWRMRRPEAVTGD